MGLGWCGCLAALSGCIGFVDLSAAALDDDALTQIAAEIEADNELNETGDQPAITEPAGRSAPPCVALGEPSSAIHQAMFESLNQYRRENGLPPLIYSTRLEAAAESHLRDLWQRNFFSHTNPDGKGPGARAVAAGFCHQYVGENLAAGQTTVENAMQAWKNSPGHNANMLEPLYVYVGVSYSIDPSGRRYWAQEFAYELP